MVPQEIFLKVLVPKLLPGNAFKLSVLLSDHIILYIRRIFLAPGGGGGGAYTPAQPPPMGLHMIKRKTINFTYIAKSKKLTSTSRPDMTF